MRFEVPQFIEIEDKIIGPFTWKQFVYLAGGVGMAIVIFISFHFVIFVFIGVPLAILAGLLAFYPVNNRPFSVFLESIINYYKRTRMYYWRKRANVVYRGRSDDQTDPSDTLKKIQTGHTSGISSLSRKLEMEAIKANELKSYD